MKEVNRQLSILRANLINQFQRETAFFGHNISRTLSAFMYNILFIVLIEILFGQINQIAGYTKNEIYFLSIISEATFYVQEAVTGVNMMELIRKVNRGDFDFTLIRPVNAQFQSGTESIMLLQLMTDAVPVLSVYALFLIDWSALDIALAGAIYGTAVMLVLMFAERSFMYLLILPVFWLGDATEIFLGRYIFTGNALPLEGMPLWFKFSFASFVPTIFLSAGTASVMLNKTSGPIILGYSVTLAITFYVVRKLVWNLAIKRYSSASS
jgi:ABC-2 type transport system permease protein